MKAMKFHVLINSPWTFRNTSNGSVDPGSFVCPIFSGIVSLLCLCFCTTHPHSEGRSEYLKIIRENSAGDTQFAGVYENFEFRSTLFTRKVSLAVHKRLKQYYDWNEEENSQKLSKRMEEMNSKTKIWLSFYTPSGKDNNLSNKRSIWKIYLFNQDRRYEGKPYPANTNLNAAKALIPYHSRWTTAYYVDFPVPTDQLQSPVKLVITGPLGRREVIFPNQN